jgi:ribonuclease-3
MAEAHPKGVLLERAQKLGMGRPEFRTERTGPEHEPSFLSDVIVDGEVVGTGQGGSKRTAEKNAADEALAALDARESSAAQPTSSGGRTRSSRRGGRGAKAAHPESSDDGGTPASEAHEADEADEADDDAAFAGPWPMFDDLLASVLGVAERRVSVELRGDAARVAIRDFSLTLYKELLADLGEVVEEEDEDQEED